MACVVGISPQLAQLLSLAGHFLWYCSKSFSSLLFVTSLFGLVIVSTGGGSKYVRESCTIADQMTRKYVLCALCV